MGATVAYRDLSCTDATIDDLIKMIFLNNLLRYLSTTVQWCADSQNNMEVRAYQNRIEMNFKEGNMVYMKIQTYRLKSLANRTN